MHLSKLNINYKTQVYLQSVLTTTVTKDFSQSAEWKFMPIPWNSKMPHVATCVRRSGFGPFLVPQLC